MKKVMIIVPSFALTFDEEDHVPTELAPDHYKLKSKVSDEIREAIWQSIFDQLDHQGYTNIAVRISTDISIPELIHVDKKSD